MGKVILEFDSFEEMDEIQDALDGGKWKAAVWNIDQRLRSVTKYGASMLDQSKEACEVEMDVCNRVRDIIREELNEFNLKIE